MPALDPTDLAAELAARNVPAHLHAAIIDAVQGLSQPSSADRAYSPEHERTRLRLAAPDAAGHRLWTGPLPAYGHPRAVWHGKRIDIVRWFALAEYADQVVFDDDRPLVRLCHSPLCFSPLHFTQPGPRPAWLLARDADPLQADRLVAEEVWDAIYPRPLSSRRRYGYTSDGLGGGTCSLGHPCTIYNAELRRSHQYVYCAACGQLERNYTRNRKQYLQAMTADGPNAGKLRYGPLLRLAYRLAGEGMPRAERLIALRDSPEAVVALSHTLAFSPYSHEPEPGEPDYVPSRVPGTGPTLAEMLKAQLAGLDDDSGAEVDTAVS